MLRWELRGWKVAPRSTIFMKLIENKHSRSCVTALFTRRNTISISNIYLLLLHHIYNIIIFFHSFRQHYSPNSFSAIIVGFYWAIKKLSPWLSPENPAVHYFVIHNTISYSREHKLIIKLLMIIMIITFQVCTHSWSHSPGWG